MTTINETYINALLADAAYVNLHVNTSNSSPLLTGPALTTAIAARLTQPQADFITTNFDVVNQELSPTGGFDAVVWKGKPGTAYEGKVYVSMRGTQETTDFSDDADLAAFGVPVRQIVSMVNWWLRLTTPPSAQAVQIQELYRVVPSTPTPIVVFDGFANVQGSNAANETNFRSAA